MDFEARSSRPQGLQVSTSQLPSHSQAVYDRVSMSPSFSMASAPSVSPDPAYIAASAASQIVTSDFRSQISEGGGDVQAFNSINAIVSTGSLILLNNFLDRLLYNFLASAKSISLASLRVAVTEVLKPRLAREAISGADEELQEFLGGGDEEELAVFHNGQEPTGEWDLDMVWRRTRLRCMVYTRLGDMEEEEEEMYIEQEHLEDIDDARRPSRDLGSVSPAVAIFLTSILEFVGELALTIAGDAALKRFDHHRNRADKRLSLSANRLVVEETDMEKVAFNTTLGRLWRSWRRLIRSPTTGIQRRMSFDRGNLSGMRSLSHGRLESEHLAPDRANAMIGQEDEQVNGHQANRDMVQEAATEDPQPSPLPESIPLPSNENDVAEIEVPGYAPLWRRADFLSIAARDRPYSVMGPMTSENRMYSPAVSRPQTAEAMREPIEIEEAKLGRHRSNSLPSPAQTPRIIAEHEQNPYQFGHSAMPCINPIGAQLDPQAAQVAELREAQESAGVCGKSTRSSKKESPMHLDVTPANDTPNSIPTTPLHESMLNAISRHAARELSVSSSVASDAPSSRWDINEDTEPIDENVLGIKVEDTEAAIVSSPSTVTPTSRGISRKGAPNSIGLGAPSPLSDIVSPILGAVSPLAGTVSPIAEEYPEEYVTPLRKGDVSPIQEIEDEPPFIYVGDPLEEEEFVTSNSDYAIQPSPPKNDAPRVSQLPSAQQNPAKDLPATAAQPESQVPQVRPRRVAATAKDDLAKDDKREAFVVMDDLPPAGPRDSGASSISGKDLQLDGSIRARGVRAGAIDPNVPPLTPLREMMEAAPSTSDEASSYTQSVKDRPQGTSPYSARSASLSSSYSQTRDQSIPSVLAKSSDSRRQLPAVYTNYNTDRAGVQRVSPADLYAREPGTPQGRKSESSGRLLPSTPLTESPVSQKIKGLVGWQNEDDSSSGSKPRKSLDKARSNTLQKPNRSAYEGNEKQRSFDQLIQSDETIQYTLTPNVMRDLESPDSPRYAVQSRTKGVSPQKTAFELECNPVQQSAQPPQPSQPLQRPVSRSKPINGLSSNPVRASEDGRTSLDKSSIKPSFKTTTVAPVKKALNVEPRDARIDADVGGLKDFADFIRNTGPDNIKPQTKSLPKPPTLRSSIGSQSQSRGIGSIKSRGSESGAPLLKSISNRSVRQPLHLSGKKSEVKAARKAGVRLQPRDASTKRSEGNFDLIDFIRQGPPVDHANGSHRIPRTVAPFRTTMDSDEIHALGHGKPKDAASVSSTQDSLIAARSIVSSTNSRTGLLDATNRSSIKGLSASSSIDRKPNMRNTSPLRNQNSAEEYRPPRRQHRNKDPYALESDEDEDEEDEAYSTPKPNRRDESLFDFLNSVPPPSGNAPAPIKVPSAFDNIQKKSKSSLQQQQVSSGSPPRTLQRKVSGSSMRARFTRSGSANGDMATSQASAQQAAKPARSPTTRSPTGPAPSPVAAATTRSETQQALRTSPGYSTSRDNNQLPPTSPYNTSSRPPAARSPSYGTTIAVQSSPIQSSRQQSSQTSALPQQQQQQQPLPSQPRTNGISSSAAAPLPSTRSGKPPLNLSELRAAGMVRPKQAPQARTERPGGAGGDSMRDLADFLKNSGPPPGTIAGGGGVGRFGDEVRDREGSGSGIGGNGGNSGGGNGGSGNGFSRMFSRRKKSVA
ncbi:hypothetical protein MMC25_001338 [Agyrium rufum]|nr:hypothetical protein [Agyrium rufum]